ncbi:hypothetical protein AAC387_Pa03g1951 [Persea americana]
MDGYNENSPTMMKPGGFQGIPMESRKFTEEKGNKRQALRDIKNFVGAPPPYPRAINKRRLPDKSALDDNNQQFAGHRPMTRKFPASLAEKQLSHQDDCDLEEIEMTDLDAEPVLDIDSSDFNNPLAVVDYVEDIYTYYRQTEVNYWAGGMEPAVGRLRFIQGERERGSFRTLWFAFLIVIGGLLLDVLISISLGVSAFPLNVIIGILLLLGLGTLVRIALECCRGCISRRVDANINPGYHPSV